ncbi:MAG: sigma 54-interacting transcriptional regulator [Lentisphaeria bacterium]|nr:sigma 54-interacting transcriptional regulator [Lentisphaeria bacterium]
MFTDAERSQIRLIGDLIYTNPFGERRQEIEHRLLGRKHIQRFRVWHSLDGDFSTNLNLPELEKLCGRLVERGLSFLKGEGLPVQDDVLTEWDLLVIYWLFSRYSASMSGNIYLPSGSEEASAKLYGNFLDDYNNLVQNIRRGRPSAYQPEKIFAMFHQVHRAFNYIFDYIGGGTEAAARLRCAIWESIFSHDMNRYYRQLHSKMNGITTLITGESGTGKELAAQAIAYSQYIPFDGGKQRFARSYRDCFRAVQLSALPPTLIESELFGHVRGAFTNAIHDRKGCFENCLEGMAVFLDEIGDISLEVQVKLLRLLQTRQFCRIGDSEPREFSGKVIAATNADLSEKCADGQFRQDFLFRICSDVIRTSPLRTLLDGREEELRQMVLILSRRLLDAQEAVSFAQESSDWIIAHLGVDYTWPGNVRELEQCLRNLLLRGSYSPLVKEEADNDDIGTRMMKSGCTLDELTHRYVNALYQREGSVAGVARQSGMDRRTIRKLLDREK